MQKRGVVLLTFSILIVSGSSAIAQQKGQTGLTFGLPGMVGLVWHVSDNIAIRPEAAVSIATGHNDPDSTFAISNSSTTWGVGASALFYVQRRDAMSVYLSPRFSFSRTSNSSTQVVPEMSSTSNGTGWLYSGAGSLGVQYALSPRFSVFGELGIEYSRQRNSTVSTGLDQPVTGGYHSTSHRFATRTGIGAALYF